MLHLSQGLLNVLTACPRKFQHRHLEQLGVPFSPEQQARLTWGSRFHLLMQQRSLGLSVNPLLTERPAEKPIEKLTAASELQQLHQLADRFVEAVPELFEPNPSVSRQSEHHQACQFQGYLLDVVYDLLVLEEHQAQILDWKTYSRPQETAWLAQNWQTRLYLFVLAETSRYAPEQISMTYWFIPAQGQNGSPDRFQPEQLNLPYSTALHKQARADLTALLVQLTGHLERYRQENQPFPQVLPATDCETCAFSLRCRRTPGADLHRSGVIVTLKDIEEVAI